MQRPYSTSPASNAVAVTPHDSTNLSDVCRALYIGTAGNMAVVTADGATVLFSNVPAGSIIPIAVSRVNSTNTTASAIVALY